MATSIDFNTRVLSHSSGRVLGYSDDFLSKLHILHIVMYKLNRAAREVTLERNWAADFSVPVYDYPNLRKL